MLQTLREFKGLSHRCEWVTQQNGIDWYDDSKGTNVGATIAAIQGLGSATKGKLILIAGGRDKGADFSLLRPAVTQYVKTLVLIGEDAALIAKALEGSVAIQYAKTLADAVFCARNSAQAGDAVLLSPVCTSFDMFRNAEDRGDQFKAIIRTSLKV
jgi:UDP-N-acetylmuramoylalanine--D-glutamate ligase